MMDISLYYQVLDIGILYEKGRKNGKLWRIGERKRLKDEVLCWQKILDYISREKNGNKCCEKLFEDLENLCKKYKFPNYERILDKKEELINCDNIFERRENEEARIHSFMEQLLSDIKNNLNAHGKKEMVYRILAVLHNLPKAMHGKNILNNNSNLVSYADAVKYAKGYMDEKKKKQYNSMHI